MHIKITLKIDNIRFLTYSHESVSNNHFEYFRRLHMNAVESSYKQMRSVRHGAPQ
jgi:hypothetical protein